MAAFITIIIHNLYYFTFLSVVVFVLTIIAVTIITIITFSIFLVIIIISIKSIINDNSLQHCFLWVKFFSPSHLALVKFPITIIMIIIYIIITHPYHYYYCHLLSLLSSLLLSPLSFPLHSSYSSFNIAILLFNAIII